MPFADTASEGRWVYPGDRATNRLEDMPWIIAQPNGGIFENCAALEPAYSTVDGQGRTMVVVDIGCGRHHCYYCRLVVLMVQHVSGSTRRSTSNCADSARLHSLISRTH